MPPKRAPAPAKKKVAVDPTFGMKNKKGKKAQEIQRQAQNSGRSKQDIQAQQAKQARKEAKEARKEQELEHAMLFRPVPEKQKPQVIPPGVDPKSVLCIYFKRGHCQFGENCKLSHDLNVENKTAKRDMFSDGRAAENKITTADGETIEGTMGEWDSATLVRIVNKKAATRPSNASDKVCKFFLRAIEKKTWGWFWVCPNGGDKCPYKHALPPGFVLVDKNAPKEKVETRPLEEVLEEERSKIVSGTKVNPETFAAWKLKINKQKQEELIKAGKLRERQIKSGETRATGRELLSQAPERFIDEPAKGEEDVDVLSLLKQKNTEEDEVDRENARIAQELAEEVERELKEQEEQARLEAEAAKANGSEATEPVVLQTVDTTLFTADDVIDDFSDEEK
eukprot:TRINITY_DN12995_c0_g1_i1.p1 TRINITY_DN12995_c0_g1~~TRINITY_DN12995_c0_g1_i1.p1  ORF type:complete len:405 (+),score=130.57 TRINITY_DN12995_c0_g1_i1:31-1215(+)